MTAVLRAEETAVTVTDRGEDARAIVETDAEAVLCALNELSLQTLFTMKE